MFPPKKILFPVDFSERSIAAARMVETIGGHFQAEVTLLHVVEPLTYNDLPTDTTQVAEEQLSRFLVDEFKHFDVERALAHGDPAMRIVEHADQTGADLIMLPTHGYGRFRRFILGSVAAKVLHDARRPVWTDVHVEKIPELENISFKRVLCALDLKRQSCEALQYAAQFAAEFDAALSVVHVIPAARDILDVDPEWQNVAQQSAEAEIENRLNRLGIKAEVRIEADEVPDGVAACAEALNADLLVIGRSEEDGVLGRLRTNAYSIIRQSPCPVISV